MKRLVKHFGTSARRLSGWLRVAFARLMFGRDAIAASVQVQSGVRIRATDGGTLALDEGVTLDRYADITVKYGLVQIGARSYLGQFCVICAREHVTIGTDCLIGEHVTIRDQDHIFDLSINTAQAGFRTGAVHIGNNVWIGAKSTITKGVTIGDNAVIGANSVVTSDIAADSVAVGAPAREKRAIRSSD